MKNCARHFDKELSFYFCLNDNYVGLVDKLTTKDARFDYEDIRDYWDLVLISRDMKIAFEVYKCIYYQLLLE